MKHILYDQFLQIERCRSLAQESLFISHVSFSSVHLALMLSTTVQGVPKPTLFLLTETANQAPTLFL